METWKSYIWDYKNSAQYIEKLRKGFPPLIITVAITGGVAGKEENPLLPETPEEQADSTYEAYKAGASAVHVHVRNPKEGYATVSVNPEDYRRVNKLIRERCPDIIINNTTGGSAQIPRALARISLEGGPEMASLNCGPLVQRGLLRKRVAPLTGRDQDVLLGAMLLPITNAEVESVAAEMQKKSIKPELEVYHPQMFNVVGNLIRRGLLDAPYSFSLICGDPVGMPATPLNLVTMIQGLPDNSIFQLIGVAYMQPAVVTMGMLMGGNVRVGFEDNMYYRRGEPLKSNADAVKKVVQLAEILERKVATPQEARAILGLSSTPSKYD